MAEPCDVCCGPVDNDGNCRKGADDCFEDGYALVSVERDSLKEEVARLEATVRGQAALLARAREFALDVQQRVDQAISDFTEEKCPEPPIVEAFPAHASAPETTSESATAAPAVTGGPSTSSFLPSSAPVDEPTNAGPVGTYAAPLPQCSGWSLESFDLGFRVGRSATLGELHIVLTESGEGEPAPTAFDPPPPVLAFLLTGVLPKKASPNT